MKKFLNIFGIVAIVATMLSGCTSDVKEDITIPTQKRIVTVTANVDEASRTVLDETNMRVKWDENDYQQMQLIELGRNNDGDEWVEIQRATADEMALNGGGETATFTFSLTDATRSTYSQFQYRAILIYDDEEMGYGTQKEYYIKNTQNASATSFDPRADILIAKPQTFNAVQNSLSFKFARAVAITKMTITGLAEGEDVRSVSFLTYLDAEQYGASIVGKVVPTYDASGNGTIQLVDGADSYDNKRVTMSYTTEEATASGFYAYFVTMPVELTQGFTVRVVTESNFYERQIDLAAAGKSLSLVLDKLNKFSVALSSENIVKQSATYTKVTDAGTLKAGDKLILVCESNNAVAGSLSSSYLQSTSLNGTVGGTVKDSKYYQVFTLGGSEGEWTLANNDEKLLGATAAKKLAWGSGTTTWTINITDGNATITNTNSNNYGTLQYNYNNGNPRFLNYTSSQTAIQIYRQVPPEVVYPRINVVETQNISFESTSHTVNYTMQTGEDDFMVSGHSDWITKASIDTPGVISYTVSKNTTGSNRQGNIIIQSEAHPDITYQIDILQTGLMRYDLVTDISGIVAGDYIIIAKDNKDAIGYLPNTGIFTANGLPNDYTLGTTSITGVLNDMSWTFVGDKDNMAIKSGDKYLRYNASSPFIALDTTTASWSIAKVDDVNAFYISASGANLEAYNGKFTTYTLDTDKEYFQIYLYKKFVDPATQPPTVTLAEYSYTFTGEQYGEETKHSTAVTLDREESVEVKIYSNAALSTLVNPTTFNASYADGNLTYYFTEANDTNASRKYWVVVEATNANGTTPSDAIVVEQQTRKLNAPTIKTFAITTAKIYATWTVVANASGYTWTLKHSGTQEVCREGVTVANEAYLTESDGVITMDITAAEAEATIVEGDSYTLTVQAVGDGTQYTNSNVVESNAMEATAPLAEKKYYNKVTSLTAGKKYILVMGDYILNGTSISNKVAAYADATSIVNANKIESTAVNDVYAVTITAKDASTYNVQFSDSKYLTTTSSKTDFKTGASAPTTAYTIAEGSDSNAGKFSIKVDTRGLCYNSSASGFKNYGDSNFGKSDYGSGYFDLYELED